MRYTHNVTANVRIFGHVEKLMSKASIVLSLFKTGFARLLKSRALVVRVPGQHYRLADVFPPAMNATSLQVA
jgi:hypothetical protein